jgi:hypothetical protein
MKRLTVVLAALFAVLALGAVALGQTPTRAIPNRLTATTKPKRDRTAPYTFTTRGTLQAPNVNCPPGTTDPDYCTPIRKADACAGKVSIKYKKGSKTVSSRRAGISSKSCTYKSTTRFKAGRVSGKLKVVVRFLGNRVLQPRSAKTQTVRAG